VAEAVVVQAQGTLLLEMVGRVVEHLRQQQQLVEQGYQAKDMLEVILFLTAVLAAAVLGLLGRMFILYGMLVMVE